ncbi:hypothetical protein X943_003272 [Babesia divergens]|uniref:Uncharacterized protein n=1 Tax=Babesia divergens TaxID=32595 RepID=A0AAD9G7K7_BABDI|nr:hypothetical protein X943_003272 [Babesia divergens]
MPMTAEREALIKQHNKLKSELDDIKTEMDRLEKANEHLRRQNINMRQMLEGHQAAGNTSENTATGITKLPESQRAQPLLSAFSLPNADFIRETISQASAIGDAATGELFKQAYSIADDFVKKLQLSDGSGYPDYDDIFHEIVEGASAHGGVGVSLSCDESCMDSATESVTSDQASPRPKEVSRIVHMGYVREATDSGRENMTAKSAPQDAR